MKVKNRKENEGSNLKKEALLNCNPKNRFSYLAGIFVFFWPLIYLFRDIIPINGQYTAIGNDFIVLYYRYKIYLLACLSMFKFPLWSPAEAAGFPFFTNPFAQVFYPLNLPLALWYKISGGYNPLEHQIFTVLGISIFALGLYKWLRLINKNIKAVILSTVIISVSFKMTEILRFPNAVHTTAWYPWVLYAITKIFKSQSLKSRIYAGLIFVFFIVCMCTAGYPYYVYYSQFLFLPYILIFLVRPLRRYLLDTDSIKWKPVIITLVICAILSGLICGPYLLAIKNLTSQTTDRTGVDFDYSTQHVFNLVDTIGSLIYPPASQTEGGYFFSITALLIIILYLFTKSASRLPANSHFSGEAAVKIFFILWIGIISYISYGRSSYLFIFLWKYMPGFSSLRVWGRLNIILLPILAWLLSLAFNHFESVISGSVPTEDRSFWKKNQTILTLILAYVVILCAQIYMFLNKVHDIYWIEYLRYPLSYGLWFLCAGIAAFVVILLILIIAKKYVLKQGKILLVIIPFLLTIAASFEMWPLGTHMWTIPGELQKNRIWFDIDKINMASFNFPRIEGDSHRRYSLALYPYFSVGILPNWYFNRYVKFFNGDPNDLQAQRILLGVIGGQRVFFSESIAYNTVSSFLMDSLRFGNHGYPLSYTGDKLEWRIDTPSAGYVSFIDNWDSNWKVFVDGKEKKIELLFGTFKSVTVEKGEHRIEFVYKPSLRTVLGIGG